MKILNAAYARYVLGIGWPAPAPAPLSRPPVRDEHGALWCAHPRCMHRLERGGRLCPIHAGETP